MALALEAGDPGSTTRLFSFFRMPIRRDMAHLAPGNGTSRYSAQLLGQLGTHRAC